MSGLSTVDRPGGDLYETHECFVRGSEVTAIRLLFEQDELIPTEKQASTKREGYPPGVDSWGAMK